MKETNKSEQNILYNINIIFINKHYVSNNRISHNRFNNKKKPIKFIQQINESINDNSQYPSLK